MISSGIVGIFGLIITIMAGTAYLGLSIDQLLYSILASNLVGAVSLFAVLRGEQIPWVRKHLMTRPLTTWPFLVFFYFGGLLGAVPFLRDLQTLCLLAIPLILTTGFMLILFGPIQDWRVARSQRRLKSL